MNDDDYLWDKSGEPDPEIERLENTLGRLRFQRPTEPLALPSPPPRAFRYGFSPMLAAAAAIVILVLAGAVWLGLRQSKSVAESETVAEQVAPARSASKESLSSSPVNPVTTIEKKNTGVAKGPDIEAAAPASAPKKQPLRRRTSPVMTAKHSRTSGSPPSEQLARGENAKAQLILALHLASDKLNVIQKRIQASPGT